MAPTLTTVEQAFAALQEAEEDLAADFGDEMVEMGYRDLVEAVSYDCTPDVKREFQRRTLGYLLT